MAPKDELEARLMAEAQAAIKRMLAERDKQENLTITEIERLARTVGQAMMQDISQELVAEESQRNEARACPKCGQKMRDKGKKGRNIITETGTVWIERRYYYCENCREGIFPPR
jgi:uncharacterized protein with PIN domain